MNYQEAREFISRASVRGIEPGLASITRLLAFLGNPQDELKFIHIAGTNGKGSVLTYLSAILQEAGFLVGRYISPTLFSYRERIQINETYISREDFARHLTRTAEAMERMKEEGMALPTVFEVETAVSFLYFREKKCDLVLLETGMGGLLDATNVIRTPVLTVLASISMDHMKFLGSTLAEIAEQKAGIIKPGAAVVSAPQQPEAEQVIRCAARRAGSPCVFVRREDITDPRYGLERQSFCYRELGLQTISLAGPHQVENAAVALECVRALRGGEEYRREGFGDGGYVIPEAAVRRGLERARWKGRFSVICHSPLVVLDGAHNPDAALRLRESILEYFPDRKKYYILGVFSDKEYDKIINITADLAEYIYTVETPDNPRALPARELAEAVRRVNPRAEAAGSIREAVEKSFSRAGREDVILVFGSLSFLGEAERAVKSRASRQNERQ